jgi:hypothetical protein
MCRKKRFLGCMKLKYNNMDNTRVKLVNAIYDYSTDKIDLTDWLAISKSSEEQLLDRLIKLLEWYAK